jgi:hypothetical protein
LLVRREYVHAVEILLSFGGGTEIEVLGDGQDLTFNGGTYLEVDGPGGIEVSYGKIPWARRGDGSIYGFDGDENI